MDAPRELGRLLLVLGIVLAGAGALLLYAHKLPFRLGRLPGDIAYQGRHGSLYFPLATCILLSVALTLLFLGSKCFPPLTRRPIHGSTFALQSATGKESLEGQRADPAHRGPSFA